MRRLNTRILATTSVTALAALGFAAPALAQNADGTPCTQAQRDAGTCTDQPAATQPASNPNIVVTGSRIRRPNLESNVPITSVSADDLTAQGDVNVGEALNDLPSLRSTFSQANSTRFIGTTGLNLLDLRGLGESRTLVLVNGRRHITASPGDFLVDVNTIPTDLIERVDVITGGSSAVYGSDAVAGVVNFVMRRDFDGIRLRGQGGVSQQGDRGIEFVSLTAGRNFFDDRANVAINLEYVNANPLYFTQRPGLTGAYDGRCQFDRAFPSTGEGPTNSNGVPDQTFLCGIRNATISNGGTVTGNISAATCQNPAILQPVNAALAARCLSPGTAQGEPRIFRFDTAGNLLQDIPATDLRPNGSGNIIDNPATTVPGSTLRDTGLITPGLDRYTANILMHFDVSDAFRPFAEAKYVHIFSRQEGQPSFFQGSFGGFFGQGNGIRCDNGFLTAQNLAVLQSQGYCAGGATFAGIVPVNRFNVDFGGRSELVTRDTWRVVAGIQGDFNDDWNYEVSFNYGHVKIHQDELNDLIIDDPFNGFADDGFLLAVDAVRNAQGQIVCRVNQASVTRPDCVPINVFGTGAPSQAALDFVNTTSFVDSSASEYDAVAFVNGDSSQLFSFPGGPARFVIGGEWRRETAFLEADPLSANFGTFFNAFATFDPPALEVKEVFGELELPLLRDLPFAQELTITGAARYSDYNTSANHTFAWNINGTWAPVRDIRFRANYSQSVRVPTLSDLFTPAGQNFAFVGDPCDVQNIGPTGGNRQVNCASQGIPAGFINTPARTQTIGFLSAGNPFLNEETSKSLTLGGVLTPRWLPGFSLTVDYYRIRVHNLIAVLGAQTILNQCYDLPSLNNQYCQLIFPRNPDFTFADPALISAGVNFAEQKADGVDFELNYRRTFGNGHRLGFRGILTYVLRRDNYVSPTDPAFADRQLSELGDPQITANAVVTYGFGPFDMRYSLNYIGRQTIGAYENYFSVQGRPPVNPDSTTERYYPVTLYHNVRLNYRVNERFEFYGGIDNIFDTPPPFGVFGTGGGDPYDPIGRYFYAGAQVDF
jgi:outer membrane receptor protein involved in Fe transport